MHPSFTTAAVWSTAQRSSPGVSDLRLSSHACSLFILITPIFAARLWLFTFINGQRLGDGSTRLSCPIGIGFLPHITVILGSYPIFNLGTDFSTWVGLLTTLHYVDLPHIGSPSWLIDDKVSTIVTIRSGFFTNFTIHFGTEASAVIHAHSSSSARVFHFLSKYFTLRIDFLLIIMFVHLKLARQSGVLVTFATSASSLRIVSANGHNRGSLIVLSVRPTVPLPGCFTCGRRWEDRNAGGCPRSSSDAVVKSKTGTAGRVSPRSVSNARHD
ncbi:hypothetical protein CF326_g9467 [Tilletia indica]|nr:hypothetical protein CF326_g9467 [Tilletia indica]